ncbi:MAG: hypothetical protein OEZ51_06375 [Nitrospinota bacterium]|nr:hypothetical protein [Nitrospinota bacterium]
MNDQKVAIFEGTYSEIRGGKLSEGLKPRRRGYKIGETLGHFRIDTIDKTHATLSAIEGSDLTLTISKTPDTKRIQKAEGGLIQKNKTDGNPFPGAGSTVSTSQQQGLLDLTPPPPNSDSGDSSLLPGNPDSGDPNSTSPSTPNADSIFRQKSLGF